MINFKSISLVIVCNLFVTSFSAAQEKECIKIQCLNSANAPLTNQQPYKHVRIVELEKVPLLMRIDQVDKLEMNNEYIFIQTNNKLYTYSQDGQLIAPIGRQGNREDEYSQLSSFYIDNGKKEISIIDYTKNKVIHYNFWGNFIATEVVPANTFLWGYQTLLTADKQLLNYHSMSMNDTKAYTLFDLQNKKANGSFFSYQPITLDNFVQSFSKHPMAQSGKDIDLIMPLCDTVYTYLTDVTSFRPKYIIESSDRMAAKTSIRKNTPSYTDDLFQLMKEGYFTGFNSIFETETKVLLSYVSQTLGYLLFDKSTQEGTFYSLDCKNKVFPFYLPICTYNNEFVACLQAEVLCSQIKVKDKKLQRQIKNLRNGSTCLVFYEF